MSEILYCVNHPTIETYLRCNRCGQPICPKCAVRTEVGYRCRNCINQQQQVFYSEFRTAFYAIAVAVALPLGLVAGWLVPDLGWFALFLGPLIGVGIAEAASWAVRRRRGQYMWLVVAGCIVLGGLPKVVLSLLLFTGSLSKLEATTGFINAWPLVWSVVYLFGAAGAASTRLRPSRR